MHIFNCGKSKCTKTKMSNKHLRIEHTEIEEKTRFVRVFIDDYLNYNNHLKYFVHHKMKIIDLHSMEIVQMMMRC